MNSYSLNEHIVISEEKIIAIDFIQNTDKIVLAKVDNYCKLFFHIIDVESDFQKNVYLSEDIHINPDILREFDRFNKSIFSYNHCYHYLKDKKLYNISEFKSLSDNTFYFILGTVENYEKIAWYIKINFDGQVIEKKVFDLYKRYKEYNLIFGIEFVFFDIEKFREYNLTEFFDDFFDDDDFRYNLDMGDSCDVRLSLDNKKLGVSYFFKDNDEPRGNFSLFDVTNFEKPNLVFSYKSEESVFRYKFIENDSKIIYWNYQDREGILIEYIIRELNKDSFEKKQIFNIERPLESYGIDSFYYINNFIIEVYYDKIVFHNTITKERYIIQRDVQTPYCLNKNKLFYIVDSKLKMKIIQ